ncbi:hypothetical protein FRB94_006647 [Tulasnella sp. JGI-2019a]|nr:hypothetical protein FRB94_006647 [Tulasnella sp. JGI-2019a]KAG9017721.1 hypothetical protein FRB93_004532 [Tulasnella sp. JGI-2019a]KAG9027870.1 hypothetical protein FRB95_007104 [Tulasnella sp. JGI-2019a]
MAGSDSVSIASTSEGIVHRALKALFQLPIVLVLVLQLHLRDVMYTVLALTLPYRKVGKVIPHGKPGYAGLWPKYMAPLQDDSRSPCTALNALANHGILPRNGRQITYQMMIDAIRNAYNLAPTLAEQLTASAFLLDQGRGWIDLHDLNATNVVQHDASLTRPDIAFCPDQSYPHPKLVDRMLACATGRPRGSGTKPRLTSADLAYHTGMRRAECKATNGEYSLSYSFIHKFFGAGNSALISSVFDGNVDDLRIWLAEERFPDDWEPKVRWYTGHTILFAQKTSIEIEFNTHEHQRLRSGDKLLRDQTSTMRPPPFDVVESPVTKQDSGISFSTILAEHGVMKRPKGHMTM